MIGGRVVITGIGIVSPIGSGKQAFWNGLKEGKDGVTDVSLFDTSNLSCHRAAQVIPFEPELLLGRKGLKYLDRSTQLVGCAASLALADSNLEARKDLEIGLVLGTTFGSLDSISRFDQEALREGPRYVNPMAFPNTVINSPAGHTAIRYGMTGLNATIGTGIVSSLQAISYAADMIRAGQADILVTGGVEELCLSSYFGLCKIKLLSGSNGSTREESAPFDVSRNGFIVGEGAALLVLESADHAKSRGAQIYAEIKAFGTAFRPDGEGILDSMELALRDGGLRPEDVDYISASANGSVVADGLEARAIFRTFGDRSEKVAIGSIKSMVGESMGASGAMQACAAILALNEGIIPPTIHFQEADSDFLLHALSGSARNIPARIAMVNSIGCDLNSASLILERYEA